MVMQITAINTLRNFHHRDRVVRTSSARAEARESTELVYHCNYLPMGLQCIFEHRKFPKKSNWIEFPKSTSYLKQHKSTQMLDSLWGGRVVGKQKRLLKCPHIFPQSIIDFSFFFFLLLFPCFTC